MKTVTQAFLKKLAHDHRVKPDENLVEVTVTIRFVTTRGLESAQRLVLDQTNKILSEKRVDGYVVSKLTGLEDIRRRNPK